LLPVFDRPGIEIIADEAVQSGIDTLVLVSNRSKLALEGHFAADSELEAALEGKPDLLRAVQRSAGYSVVMAYQDEALGLGHAVGCGEDAVDGEPFAVMLPDDLILGAPALKALVDCYNRTGKSVVLLIEVPPEDTHRYGIVDGTRQPDGSIEIHNLVEKPAPEDAPSNLGIVGRYVFSPRLFDCLRQIEPGALGELQLTDAMAKLAQSEGMIGLMLDGLRLDAGDTMGLFRASLHYASAASAEARAIVREVNASLDD
jgi:UTP--glucose-1-phosphate uridylyltransferase